MVRDWARAGYRCVCIDLAADRASEDYAGGGGITFLRADVRTVRLDARPIIVFAFPPCTDLASSGARHWARKGLRRCVEALALVDTCREICEGSGAPWMIENPVGRLSTCWRAPDHIFHPCDYGGYLDPPGDRYRKRTCLWVGGGFRMPDPRPVEPEGVRQGRPDVWYSRVGGRNGAAGAAYRSVTPEGFARAVFLANRNGGI